MQTKEHLIEYCEKLIQIEQLNDVRKESCALEFIIIERIADSIAYVEELLIGSEFRSSEAGQIAAPVKVYDEQVFNDLYSYLYLQKREIIGKIEINERLGARTLILHVIGTYYFNKEVKYKEVQICIACKL